ncbi:MAG TPA: universal stress protein, partial [Nitrospirota bacterium]|nr:universal stress protein [Nitrospirota bacterium]
MTDNTYKKILVAVDGTFHASVAARYSFWFALAFHSKLFVVTIITKDMNEKEEKSAIYSISKIIDEAGGSGLDIEGVILKGDVISAIKKFVKENKIDIVFSSTRRPQKEGRFFVQSVSSGLMSGVSCNVIAIKISHPGRSLRSKRVLVPLIGDGYMD